MTRLSKGNISTTKQAVDRDFANDNDNVVKLKGAISEFDKASDSLDSEAYEAVREYFNTIIVQRALQLRNESSNDFYNKSTDGPGSVTKNWDAFMDSAPAMDSIDDSEYESLKSRITLLSNSISNADTDGLEKDPDWQIELDKITPLFRKIEEFKENDAAGGRISNILNTSEEKITAYEKFVQALNQSPLGLGIDSPLYDAPQKNAEEDNKGDDKGKDSGTSSTQSGGAGTSSAGGGGGAGGEGGGGGGSATPVTPTEPTQEEKNEEIDKALGSMMGTAASLVGMTAEQLAADQDGAFYGSDYNYKADEEWSTKFVNDMIMREDALENALDDYYNNPTLFPNPYTDSQDLLNYAVEEGSNIDFNWSEAAKDKIGEYTTENGIDYELPEEAYEPQEGDIIFFNTQEDGREFNGDPNNTNTVGQVGLVQNIETVENEDGTKSTYVNVIMGNAPQEGSDQTVVVSKRIDITDKSILGYGTINENNSDLKKIAEHPDTTPVVEPEPVEPVTPTEPAEPEYTEGPDGVRLGEGDSYAPDTGTGNVVDSEGNVYKPDESSDSGYINDPNNPIDVERDDDGFTVIGDDTTITPTPSEPSGDEVVIGDDVELPDDIIGNINPDDIIWDTDNM